MMRRRDGGRSRSSGSGSRAMVAVAAGCSTRSLPLLFARCCLVLAKSSLTCAGVVNPVPNRSHRFDRTAPQLFTTKKRERCGSSPCQPSGSLGGFLLAPFVEFPCPLAYLFRSLSLNLLNFLFIIRDFSFFLFFFFLENKGFHFLKQVLEDRSCLS
jgi:hypothetical protein